MVKEKGWFTEQEIVKFRKFVEYKLNERGISSNFTTVTPKQLQYLFELYDEYLFNGRIRAALDARRSTLVFATSVTASYGVMGLCSFNKNHGVSQCSYKLSLPADRYAKLFSANERSHSTNGLDCSNRLQCYIITFEHELCHLLHHMLIDTILAKSAKRYTMPHGRLFMCLVKKLFYHKDYKHSMIQGLDTSNTLTKEKTNIGQVVNVKNTKTHMSFKCVVLAKNPKRALIECFSLKNGRIDPNIPPVTFNSAYSLLSPADLNEEERRFLKSKPVRLTSRTAYIGQIVSIPMKDKAVIIDKKRTKVIYVVFNKNAKGEITTPLDGGKRRWNVNQLFIADSTPKEKAIAQAFIAKMKR